MSSDPEREHEELVRRLRILRFLRFFGHVPFLSVFVVAGLLALIRWLSPQTGDAIWSHNLFQAMWVLLWVLAVVGFFLSFLLPGIKCPRCGKEFHFKRTGLFYTANEFSKRCMNCGLSLKAGGS